MGNKAITGDGNDKTRTKSQSGKKVFLPNTKSMETLLRKTSFDEEKDVRLYFKFL